MTLWKSLAFFALVDKNPLGIKGVGNGQPSDTDKPQGSSFWGWFAEDSTSDSSPPQPVTFETAERCDTGTYFKNNYASSAGGVAASGAPVAGTTTYWLKRKSVGN